MIFGIRGNTTKTELVNIVHRLVKGLDAAGINYLVEASLAKQLFKKVKHKVKISNTVSEKEMVKHCNFIISIGGDGTFLATAKLVGNRNIPIIGVNLGKLGFLAETSTRDVLSFVKKVVKGDYKIDERTVLQATPLGSGKSIFGMNEMVINQSEIVKTIEIGVYFNNQLVNRYHADGMIIATPTAQPVIHSLLVDP